MRTEEIIVCDKCKFEGCLVSEKKKEVKVSMKDYASRKRSPFHDAYWQKQSSYSPPTVWVITCPECGHTIEYSEMREDMIMTFDLGSGDSTANLTPDYQL